MVREPFNKSFDEIARMTEDQKIHVMFHPRDDDGAIEPDDDDEMRQPSRSSGKSLKQAMFDRWWKRDPMATREELQERWKKRSRGK